MNSTILFIGAALCVPAMLFISEPKVNSFQTAFIILLVIAMAVRLKEDKQ